MMKTRLDLGTLERFLCARFGVEVVVRGKAFAYRFGNAHYVA